MGHSHLGGSRPSDSRPFPCDLCPMAFRRSGHLKLHLMTHTGNKPHKCTICLKGFYQTSHLQRHVRMHTGETPFHCDICQKSFKEKSSLKKHSKSHLKDDDAVAPELEAGGTNSNLEMVEVGETEINRRCSECGEVFCVSYSVELQSGKYTWDFAAHKCLECTTSASLPEQPDDTKIQIPHVVKAKFTSKQRHPNQRQQSARHSKPTATLIHDGNPLETLDELTGRTVASNAGEQCINDNDIAKCSICNEAFSGHSALAVTTGQSTFHTTNSTSEGNFICDVCREKINASVCFKTRVDRSHLGNRPYPCGVCSMAFQRSGHLKLHMMTHTGNKPHKCTICQKGFYQTSHLKRHFRTHTGETPFHCDVCQKSFKERGSLRKHSKTHVKVEVDT